MNKVFPALPITIAVLNKSIASLCLSVLLTSAALSQNAQQIDALVLEEMARQNIAGMAVGIVRHGRIDYAMGYGYNDLARTQPVTTNTVFRWGSVSKTLTAAATLKLANVNPAFSLNDRVTEHVSYWPRYGNKAGIRIKHLLSHRAGIIHYRKQGNCPDNPRPDFDRNQHHSKYYNAYQGVKVFSKQRLCFNPGSRYKYSTFGYSLLGAAIEGASGMSYDSWINRAIKKPLNMTSLQQATGIRRGFDQKAHALHPVLSGNVAWKLPGGGWESNIIDLAKFANALLQEHLLHDTRRLWTTVPGNPGYGYGIKFSADKDKVWHKGKHDNSRTLLLLYPGSADKPGIVVMINSVHSKPVRIAVRLSELLNR